MDDTQDKKLVLETESSSTQQKQSKEKEHQDKDHSSMSLSDKWNVYKGEFRKIIWPTRKELIKKTVTVIFVSLLFGVLIFGMDSIYNVGVQLFVQLVAK